MPTFPKTAVVALGSNLDQPTATIRAALGQLARHPDLQIERVSSLYLTAPVGYAEQPDFVNAVCLLHTDLSAQALLQALQQMEQAFGRARSFRNAPRTLDLDIVDYNNESYQSDSLILPHPRAHERGFVMVPLAEIAPDYCLGKHGTAAQLAAQLGDIGIVRVVS